jgi:hypothetical protein
MVKMEIGSIIGRGMGGGGYPSTPYGYQELIIEPEIEVDESPMESVREPNVVSAPIEGGADVAPAAKPADPVVIEKADDAAPVGEPNAAATELTANDVRAVEKPDVGMVDPNAIRAMLREEARQDATGASGDDDIFRSMRSTALLTIGLLAFVVIFGAVILARARRR